MADALHNKQIETLHIHYIEHRIEVIWINTFTSVNGVEQLGRARKSKTYTDEDHASIDVDLPAALATRLKNLFGWT